MLVFARACDSKQLLRSSNKQVLCASRVRGSGLSTRGRHLPCMAPTAPDITNRMLESSLKWEPKRYAFLGSSRCGHHLVAQHATACLKLVQQRYSGPACELA